MSEANAPFNHPGQPESVTSSQPDALSNPFWEMLQELESAENLATNAEADLSEVAPGGVNSSSTGNGSAQDGIPSRKVSDPGKSSSLDSTPIDSTTIAPGAEAWIDAHQSTNLADLISLIQELNQCNSILLDRVSQLEEALERSQTALKTEMKRSYAPPEIDLNADEWAISQDLTVAQEQIVNLYSQLELVHQTSQRQQILIETLTCQLEASQEHAAHLEREAALLQQRYNEQTQLLTQSENHSRDLQARLHRQQRYTLQFKAALEKSLEMSSSQYDSVDAAVAATRTDDFLPKTQQIQPWSNPDVPSPIGSWKKLSSISLDEEIREVEEAESNALTAAAMTEEPEAKPAPAPEFPTFRPKPFSVKLPGFVEPAAETPMPASTKPEHYAAEAGAAVPPELIAPVSYNLQQPVQPPEMAAAETADAYLIQKLDAVVQPLADMLAQAMLADAASETTSTPEVSRIEAPPQPPATSQAPAMEQPAPASADELLNSVMADAEDAMWQDLARLIDVTAEDVVKASLSGDLSAFESIDFAALSDAEPDSGFVDQTPPPNSVTVFSPEDFPVEEPTPEQVAPAPAVQSSSQASNPSREPAPAAPAFANPVWPSPVVYPTRTPKKRRASLAAVELPSFLRQEPGALPT